MTDNTRCEPAEGWPESRQFDIRPVTDADLDRWEEWARQHAHLLCLGALNWPMIVRSLIADRRAPAASPEIVRGLVEALDFYACVDHYPVHHAVAPEVVRNDGGGKARAALALYRGDVA